jgi:hypothetical protein
MKRKNLILAVLPIFMVVLALQSCKEEEPIPQVFQSFTEPTAVAPLDAALIKVTGTTAELKWASTDADGDPVLANVYFGTAATPPLYKTGNAALSLSVPVVEGQTYYWKVTMIDANKVMTYGPVWHFSVAVSYDINNFVGVMDCNEPGYGHYNCNFTKVSATTVSNDNFWDSGWAVSYVFDDYGNVNIIPVSYVDKAVTYDITGTGKFDNKAKSFYVNYLVKNHATGATVDSNTHTFVKK